MSSPGASKQYRMERKRREREAREQSERTRLKRGRETREGFLERRLLGGAKLSPRQQKAV
jgi:hypothetical protein